MRVQKLETAAIIIGAGPAGAGTSFFLSKHGIDHIIIDKETFPRDKVCGDACSGKTALVIERANPDWLKEVLQDTRAYMPSWGITFVAPNSKRLDIPFKTNRTKEDPAPGFTAPRLVFDDFIFRKITSPHSRVFEDARVQKIEQENGKITVHMDCNGVEYEINSSVIVGCDGDKSIVRKKFFSHDTMPKSNAVGLRAYYEGVTGLHEENFLELHFLNEMLPGYLWIFPLPNGRANVGVGILSETVRKKKINLREQMLHAITNNPALAPRFANAKLIDKIQGWGLPLAYGQQAISTENVLLVGDAASLVDPFSGEGIGNAMYSGMLAAHCIKAGVDSENYSAAFFKQQYDDVVYKRLGDEFRISATLQRLCRYPWLFNFVVNKAYKSPTLRNTISGMFYDMELRNQFMKPSFYLKILSNR